MMYESGAYGISGRDRLKDSLLLKFDSNVGTKMLMAEILKD